MVRIFRDLPYVLDLLTLSTEAGQDFTSAMATVVDKGPPGPLLDEFRIVHQEVTLGKTARPRRCARWRPHRLAPR